MYLVSLYLFDKPKFENHPRPKPRVVRIYSFSFFLETTTAAAVAVRTAAAAEREEPQPFLGASVAVSPSVSGAVSAGMVGYVQLNNFYIHFRNYFGVSPSALRNFEITGEPVKL